MSSPARKSVMLGDVPVGGGNFALIAGPCAIESRSRLFGIAEHVLRSGAAALRGGVFKLRTSPDSFQGLGDEAMSIVREARQHFGVPFVAEITDPRQLEMFEGTVDWIQIGSRNMHNYALLKELGKAKTPVLLKRGFCARIEEWLKAAEYIAREGNDQIVLCERGVRTFETSMRNTLDLAAVAWVKARSSFPVLVDPSHATGIPWLIGPMTCAAAACGADGALIEVHDAPAEALSDGPQAVTPPEFEQIVRDVEAILHAQRRTLARPQRKA